MDLFVPGRLCLFGEHSDWAGYYRRINSEVLPGKAVVSGIEQGIYATVEKSDVIRFRTILNDGSYTEWFESPLNVQKLKEVAEEGGFFSYVAGVAAYMLEYYNVGGVTVDCYKVTIPIKKGLSSSAAVCVLIARAFNILYNLHISTKGEMEAAYRGELLTPSRCGRLDQACAYGEKPVLMTFDGDNIDVEPLKVGSDLYWVFCDLHGTKDTKRILSDLNACYPFANNDISNSVQHALGVKNHELISEVLKALEKGDARKLGELMTLAQSVFDEMIAPASPNELKAPKLHRIINDTTVKRYSLGAKGVGSGGDGTAQMICANKEDQEKLVEYLNTRGNCTAFPFTIKKQYAVKKAVVPLAGYGTRLFPATKVVDKAFFPIIDFDGLAKPAIVIILEELLSAGIEEIGLIIQQEQQEEYNKLFESKIPLHYYNHLSQDKQQYNKALQDIGKKVTYIYQKEQFGFGHAVYQAESFASGEPVLLMLGDHIYKSFQSKNCAAQMIDAYEKTGQLTVSLDEIPLEKVQHYGILTGEFAVKERRLMQVKTMYEKPTHDYAREHLGVLDPKGNKHYYCVFGQYILTPHVFDLLGAAVRKNNGQKETELTPVLDEVREKYGMTGYLVDGQRYDIGIPEEYRRTVAEYGI